MTTVAEFPVATPVGSGSALNGRPADDGFWAREGICGVPLTTRTATYGRVTSGRSLIWTYRIISSGRGG